MNCKTCRRQAELDLDGELSPAASLRMRHHLDTCPACREWREQLEEEARFYARSAPALEASTALWERTLRAWESSRRAVAGRPLSARECFRRPSLGRGYAGVLTAAVILLFFVTVGRLSHSGGGYEVTLNDQRTGGTLRRVLREKDSLNTGPHTVAEIRMGDGRVTIEPGTRLRLLRARAGIRRFRLSQGNLHALLTAPGRSFFVETPAATAVDLGCSFRLEVDPEGNTLLQVTSGEVALERDGRSVTVPPGEECEARVKGGLGKPHPSRTAGE